jgi:hypothetical protein
MIDSCNSVSQNKIVSVSENKRKFTVNNKSLFTINKVTVDDCYITEGLRCDFLFEVIDEELKKVFYVELKGSDISHGIQQLEATVKHCLSIHKSVPRSCYIVASKVPKASPSTQKYKKEFKRKHSVMLYIDTKQNEVKV